MAQPDRQPRKTIRQLRQEQGWSWADLARQLGLTQGSVADGELGLSHPRGRTLLRLAHLFGVNAEDIAPGRRTRHPRIGHYCTGATRGASMASGSRITGLMLIIGLICIILIGWMLVNAGVLGGR